MAIRVRRVEVDPDRFQALAPPTPVPVFDGQPLGRRAPVTMTVMNPNAAPSDFFSLWTDSAFACSSRAVDLMGNRLSTYGELLEGQIQRGERVLIFNCTNRVNCLDASRTKWEIGPRSRERLRVIRYWFHRDRLPPLGTLFKIPETNEILTTDDPEDPESGFVAEARRAGLVGLMTVQLDEFARHNEAMWGFDPRFEDETRK